VSATAVVDRLLKLLAPHRNELVLFDINRLAIVSPLLINDPGAFTQRLLEDSTLPFALTLVANESAASNAVSASFRPSFSGEINTTEALAQGWPRGIVSLSHVALPISPNDPLYGQYPPKEPGQLYLGDIPLRGERGLLIISSDWLLRLRHNPFYEYLERRTVEWITTHG
jgi:hypothetical protein